MCPDVGGFDAGEAGFLEPLGIFREREGVPMLGVEQHVEGKEDGVGRAGAVVVREQVNNDDPAVWA